MERISHYTSARSFGFQAVANYGVVKWYKNGLGFWKESGRKRNRRGNDEKRCER
jgi:hypothetical protein